jgi:hypothetical protein
MTRKCPTTPVAIGLVLLICSCEADRYPVGADLLDGGKPSSVAAGGQAGLAAQAGQTGQGGQGGQAGQPNPPAVPGPADAGPHAMACRIPGAPMPNRPVALSSFQIAERLSRFIWAAPPDVAFLEKVTRLAPATTAEVANLAREMLDDPRADAGVRRFYRNWLAPSPTPPARDGLDATLWASFGRETDELVTHLTRYGGNFSDLLRVPFSFLDARLGQHYGVPVSGPEFRRVDLPGDQRSGVLTHGGWLSTYSRASRRGWWINGKLFCRPLPAPADPVETPLLPASGMTAREQLERATDVASCMACHQLVDPPGFLYEHYDQIGRHRTADQGLPVNAAALVQLPGFMGPLDGAAALGKMAAQSCEAQACFARQWLAAGLAAGEPPEPGPEVDAVVAAFAASRLSLREIVVIVTQSHLFLEP